jgi:HD-GYP domain-containing protein (c-di-GMP phosphodiesterase class II)
LADYIYKRQAIDDLVPGMTLGKMIVTTDGKNFLNEGAVLTLRIIQTLQLWGFRYVDIREECPPDWHVDGKSLATPLETPIESTPVLTETELRDKTSGPQLSLNETEAEAEPQIRLNVPTEFVEHYQSAVQILKKNLGKVRFTKDDFNSEEIRRMVSANILQLITDHSVTDFLQMMPHEEDYLYHHSVDVGIITGRLCLWMGYTEDEIAEAILGALLHDAGKALIPLKVLNKPGSLTDEELHLVRFHSLRGYKFLKQYGDFSQSVLLCALQHHERIDGSGYPMAVQGDKIHTYAKLIAVADVFDAMTSVRSYGKRATPYEAVEIMKREMVGKLDQQICSVFLDKLSQRFVGDIVQLSNGQRGEVVFLNPNDCTRPIVRTGDGEFVDLDRLRSLSINKMLHS